MLSWEYVVDDDAECVKALAGDVVVQQGFELTWRDDWNAVVERGSRVRNVLLGAFSPHVRVDLAIRSLPPETETDTDTDTDDETDIDGAAAVPERIVVRIDNRASGLLGGVMGAQKTRSGWSELRRALSDRLAGAGTLVEERDPGPSRLA